MPSPSPRWKVVAVSTVAALTVSVLAVLETTTATAAPPRKPANVIAVHTVTLITGDQVTVTTLAGGGQAAEVKRPNSATGGVRVQQVRGDILVLPDEALPLLTAGKLDRRLFNVTDLIEMGYDDAKLAELPLIATYEPVQVRSGKPKAPKGSRVERQLSSIGGAVLKADKKQARSVWNDLAGTKKIWLDGRVKVNLKESVPLIGAPEAWAAGYTGKGVKVAVLDTGIDATHPDLAGQIDATASFVPNEDMTDINGHGTHVASTIVGTGAASNGDYKGVAPEADLIVGKVLGGIEGNGADSWVLAGMQWAAESGADVVNMSLGDQFASDGNDPMSLAVNALTAQYGTLFVIASGNAGPGTISSPGAAASALTVGATDKQDNLAWFTSTGPLVGTGAMKPDISAPGVDITAARSQQMLEGEGLYRTISGTSMATPHVVGAAAILLQRHPDWNPQALKDALMSSAKPVADFYTPYEVGTGRLDVAAAVRNPLRANGSLFFGNFDWPHEPSDAPVTKPLTFTNSGSAAMTVNLSINGSGPFSLGATSVTVPAGGSANVNVTGDPTVPGLGQMTGYLTASDAATGTAVTRTSLGLLKEEERYNLTIKLIDRNAKAATGTVVLYKSGDFFPYILDIAGQATFRLPPGLYTTESAMDVRGERPDRLGLATLMDPETVLDRDSEVVLDASKARLLDTAAPQRSEVRQSKVDFQVTFGEFDQYRDALVIPIKYDDLYLLPTEKMTRGSFAAATRWRFGEETVSLDVLGMVPIPAVVQPFAKVTAGTDVLKMVHAGKGSAGEYSKVDARGKAVVVTRSDAVSPMERADAAAAAGATMLIVANDGIGTLNEYVGEPAIPVVTVHRDAGALLVKLAKAGVIPLRVKRVPYTSFVYDLTRNYKDAVPDKPLVYKPSRGDLARIDARYYGQAPAQEGGGYRYDMTFTPSAGFYERELFPNTRTEWVTPDQVWHEGHETGAGWTDVGYHNAYAKGTTTRLNWFAPAVRPAFTRAFFVQNGRARDFMTINVQAWSSSGSDVIEHGGYLPWGEHPTNMKLYQGDTLIRENKFASDMQYVEVPSGKKPFHLVLDASRPDSFRLSTRTHTEWDFLSESNESDDFVPMTLMQLDYDLATDLSGDAKAGSVRTFSVKAGPQAGGSGIGSVRSLSVEVSYDDGATWREVKLTKGSSGWWSTNLKLDGRAGGFVSIRASAATDAGWGIKQEVIRAYGLS